MDYHAPLVADGREIRIEISVRDMRAASFVLDYAVHSGPSESDTLAATAETMLVTYNTATTRPRRLSEAERDFLAAYRAESA
jgi:acyl-CoA thioester hydrolase